MISVKTLALLVFLVSISSFDYTEANIIRDVESESVESNGSDGDEQWDSDEDLQDYLAYLDDYGDGYESDDYQEFEDSEEESFAEFLSALDD